MWGWYFIRAWPAVARQQARALQRWQASLPKFLLRGALRLRLGAKQSKGRRALLLRRFALSACSLADSSSKPKQARISHGAIALSAGLSKAACVEQFCRGCCQASQSAAAGVGRLAGPRPGPVHAREGKRPLAKRSRWLSRPLPADEPRQRFFSCWALFHAYAPHFAQKRMRPCPCTCATISWWLCSSVVLG